MTWHLPVVASLAAAMILATACGAGGPAATKAGRLPAAHHVHALRAADDGRLLLGLHGGLWRSEDAGTSWQQAGLDGQDAMAIGSAPDVAGPLLIGGHGLLARAEDPTGQFTLLQPPELGSLDVHALAQAPSDPVTAYALVVDAGLFRTTDGGQAWQQVAPVGRDFGPDVTGLAVAPTDPDTLLLAGGRTGLLRSADGGASFHRAVEAGAFAVAYVGDRGEQAVAITHRGIEVSHDGGRTWTVATPHGTLPGQPAALAATSQGSIWILTEEPRTLQRSTDDGHSWQEVARA